jgi:predicted TIM-barrel fold metal-dependent hydrolase
MQTREPIPSLTDLKLFDTSVLVGRLNQPGVRISLTEDNLLAVMDHQGIAEALVTSNFARLHFTHRRGNHWTVEFCRKLGPRLHPVWVLEPPPQPGRAPARAAVAELRAAGVKVVRLLMGPGATAPLLWCWQDLLEELQARHIPCLVDFGSCNYFNCSTAAVPNDMEVDHLREIVRAFPDLPFILSHAVGGLGIAKSVLPLMHRCPNLHLDVTGILQYWRTAVQELGPERVFFATGMPYTDPATFVGNIPYEPGLSLEARKMMSGENIRRLMEAVQ